jgi:mitotic spindle assembly checkpoint protein MAD1
VDSPDVSRGDIEMSSLNSHQLVSSLQYQVRSLQDEKRLLALENESLSKKFEHIIAEKLELLTKLQENFDYLFNENKQLLSKSSNQSQIVKSTIDDLNNKVTTLSQENSKLKKSLHMAQSTQNEVSKKYQKMSLDYTSVNGVNQELTARITQLNTSIQNLNTENSQLIKKLSSQSQSNIHSSSAYNDLRTKNISLQNINQNLQSKVDQLLQNKTSNELLKQKVTTLSNKITHLSNVAEKHYQLEIDHLKLKADFDRYFKVIDDIIVSEESPEIKVQKFAERFRQLEYESLVYKEKYDEMSLQMKESQKSIDNSSSQINHLKQESETLSQQLDSKDQTIVKLERQNVLKSKEIEFLRNLLKLELASKEKKDTDSKSIEQYLSNLENLVENYKNEIEHLQKRSNQNNVNLEVNKRPRSENKEYSSYTHLREENLKQASVIKHLEYDIKLMKDKLATFNNISNKQLQLQVLQLKLNPVAKDQFVKQETLDLLRKENEALISKYISKLDNDELIPKSIFERQENDKQALQSQIDKQIKRNKRLRETYSEKSKQILVTISKYFGFAIEFLPNPLNPNDLSSKIKLVSRYMKETNSYLVVDIESKSMKAIGDQQFKSICQDLLEKWVKGKDQVPCFLSALTLTVYGNNE